MHDGEESGADAALRVLWELADRSDCAATQILDESIVVILPVQNPDGREADTRRNAYGFDLNRDWFARTQPETDGKFEAIRRYPPVLFIDAHEMGNQAGYFFPPNADPIYHETPDTSVNWINNLYGASMRREFDARAIPYFNYAMYDLFYQGYGDTVPSTGFSARRDDVREDEQPSHGPPRVRAVPHAVDVPLGGGGQQGRDPRGLARVLGDGASAGPPGTARNPTRSCSQTTRCSSPCPTSGSATTSSATTIPRRRARRGRWCGGCSAWTCASRGSRAH